MRAVEQDYLEFFVEMLLRECLLGRSLDKTDYVLPQQGGRPDISHAAASTVKGEHGVVRTEMRKQKRAGSGTCFRRALNHSPGGVPRDGSEDLGRKGRSGMQTWRDFYDLGQDLAEARTIPWL